MTVMPRVETAAPVASVDAIRAQFPALGRRHAGRPVAYFDGPGGTQVPVVVAEAMTDYLFHHNANTHWQYPTSAETDVAIDEARLALADFVGGAPTEIAFGNNMTTLSFHLARALGRRWGAGDEIVVTELDHHANVAPWRWLERERGVTVRTVRMDAATGTVDFDDLGRWLDKRTRLLAIGAASNALGTVTDVRLATQMAHEVGALAFVDAVHYAPHRLIDVGAIGCDFLACSAYKFYGPHIGILWGRADLLGALELPKLDPAPDNVPDRLETGTQNHEGIVGARAAVDFLAALARQPADTPPATRRVRLQRVYAEMHERKRPLFQHLWRELAAMQGVTLYGPSPEGARTPTAAFVVKGASADDVARACADHALFVSSGDFYARTVVERLGQAPDGLVRVGCALYTTSAEIERLVEAVREISSHGVGRRR
ncbi:MAG: cysteine desulfurase-like protein [Gemmatimonadaceae bacterium]